MNYQAFCDGGSRGNPGPSASGTVFLKDDKIILEKSLFLGIDTNNVAEWQGLVMALEVAIEKNFFPLNIYLDSLLVVSQINDKWKLKADNLRPYYKKAKQLLIGKKVTIEHVLRAKNKEADRVVNECLDSNNN